MTGSARYASKLDIRCCICASPVRLEISKTDERGQAVHEECYLRKIMSKSSTTGAVRLTRNTVTSIVGKFQIHPEVTAKVSKSGSSCLIRKNPRKSVAKEFALTALQN